MKYYWVLFPVNSLFMYGCVSADVSLLISLIMLLIMLKMNKLLKHTYNTMWFCV